MLPQNNSEATLSGRIPAFTKSPLLKDCLLCLQVANNCLSSTQLMVSPELENCGEIRATGVSRSGEDLIDHLWHL